MTSLCHDGGVTQTARMIRRLQITQHVLFTALLAVGVARALLAGDLWWAVAGIGLLVGVWYLIGAWRLPWPTEEHPRFTWWLVGLVALWLVSALVSAEFVWVAFALWLIIGQGLPSRVGVVVGALVLVVVVARTGHAEEWSTAAVVGPIIGGLFAMALARGMRVLVRDSVAREELVASLVAAQEETAILHDELAETQREAGRQAERARLSRDIHDTLAQGFSSILLLSRAGSSTPDNVVRTRLFNQISGTAAENLEEARRVVAGLAPAPLTSGLVEALRSILDRFGAETGVRTDLHLTGDPTALPPPVEIALLRVAQSALANVRQHADADRVVVTLSQTDDRVLLDVVDDGCGFDPATVPPGPGGYGLRASRARMRELGGELDVESEPGSGTAISAHLPLGGAR